MDTEDPYKVPNQSKTVIPVKNNPKREREVNLASALSPPPKKSQNSQQILFKDNTQSKNVMSSSLNKNVMVDNTYKDDSVACKMSSLSCDKERLESTGKKLDSRLPLVNISRYQSEHKTSVSANSPKLGRSLKGTYSRSQSNSSGFKLDKSSSIDSLEQDVSLTDSLNQDNSMTESEEFSHDISGTECESLTSSLYLPNDNTGPLGNFEERVSLTSKTTPIHSQVGEVVSSCTSVSGSIKKQESGKKKKRKHSSKKTVEKMEAGDTSMRNLRPNYFVGIQISNADIHKSLIRIQEDMESYDESLFRALVDVATSHITLLVAHVDTEEALSLATSALAKCGKQLKDDLSVCPLQLTFSGISHFGHQVVYAQLVEDDHYHRLLDLAEYVRNVFSEGQVCMPDKRTLHPHLTIAKLSKAPRMRGKHAPRKIDPSSYKQHLDIHLGCQTVTGLQLLAMNKSKDHNRYYYNSAQVMFDIKCKDNMDHTQCCFPRRPILKSQRRTYTTATVATTVQDNVDNHEDNDNNNNDDGASNNWILPTTLTLVTVLASAYLLSAVIPRLRNR
ncbi:hypothetical protein Pmani_039889 [Petrolisthes manimaculis]|uniref:A-kinase anchor protein 7-like phosphoesterase domain-containing protein n=1 Tax=Petrolisthes manimaculis TaxID=1843537 RepID=A0AAE1NDE3_9EUCA|nr:hypothetical protein Pmani_039889 [Petrolisthes manimaculis]